MNNKTKNTKDLERKARKNELLPTFQLYQNYKHGLNDVEPDASISEQYLKQCIEYIEAITSESDSDFTPKNKLNLVQLELFDFRKFKHLRISFEPKLTVIIGNNGQGKTALLNSISKTLSWLNANILKEDGQGQRLSATRDIRRNSEAPYTDVFTEFSFGSGLKRIPVRLSRAKLGSTSKRDSEIKNIKELANIFRVVNDQHLLNLPLCAFYSVDRSYQLPRSTKENAALREERFDAYNFALTGSGKFEHFVEWFIALHKKSVNDKSTEIEELKQQVKDLESSVESGITSLKPILTQAQKQLNDALLTLKSANEKHVLTDAQTKEIVVNAICRVIPSISNIWVETDSGSDIVFVTNDSIDITIEQLSDGQRTFLGLVADLVRRLVMLNPKLENPLNGQGIVLIDEIELHLHPKWQQDVLLDLQHCFPNIQFIVTTHSPLVLSTVEKNCIRYFNGIDINGTSIVDTPDFQTKGVINSDVLEQLMGTFATPQRIEEAHWLNEFETLLGQESYDKNTNAQTIYNKIKLHFGENSYELKKCDSQIRIQSMKLKVAQKTKMKGEEQ
ncbi:AAA family ATPase [Vibrio parahaemolyticus]|uniref:retron Ec78 anti-phage system effector ATPase PtuA n=2 Tax=Vibrio parahaemolyticus TaxID=670 RepID=UPI000410A92C|nr:retron Ec78 anti-phage system effector ATPase PtuA [Vibrio parahaemolyticus]WJE04180.1 retron Ec78 anti-phage system effector ATPase PtuA [Vibrio parahaemolyticus]HCE2309532.1 AAA family ATPase [Vibrio parahaemolyticus]HCE4678246.1 AAA family ATPase [Vibrio parahaemolyticus]HCG7257474.1 AAA family ATPase [Vibrio parahaemolyticus]